MSDKTVKLFAKPTLQKLLRDMRKAGYTVNQPSPGMYKAFINADDKYPVLTALNGSRGYLVTYTTSLITEVKA